MPTILGEEMSPTKSPILRGTPIKKEIETNKKTEPSNKIDQILEYSRRAAESAEKTRKYIFWNTVIQVGMIVLPLIGLLIAIPFMLKSLSSAYEGLL